MRTLYRNKQTIYCAHFKGKLPIRDEYGNETGEYEVLYHPPQAVELNVSAASGTSPVQPFGIAKNYDKLLVARDSDITETSVLWIDSLDTAKPYDYVVVGVAKSLNSVSIAVKHV